MATIYQDQITLTDNNYKTRNKNTMVLVGKERDISRLLMTEVHGTREAGGAVSTQP